MKLKTFYVFKNPDDNRWIYEKLPKTDENDYYLFTEKLQNIPLELTSYVRDLTLDGSDNLLNWINVYLSKEYTQEQLTNYGYIEAHINNFKPLVGIGVFSGDNWDERTKDFMDWCLKRFNGMKYTGNLIEMPLR